MALKLIEKIDYMLVKLAIKKLAADGETLKKEQREALLKNLITVTDSDEMQELMSKLCSGVLISAPARKMLWEKLTLHPLPSESVPAIVSALVASNAMWKEQREEMLSYLLTCPLSARQIQECVLSIVDEAECKKHGTAKILNNYYSFKTAFDSLRPWVDEERPEWKNGIETAFKKALFENAAPQDVLLGLICTDHICHLKDASIEFIDRKQLWLMMEELLFSEEYYSELSRDDPYILDCGTNIGLAIYYFKHYYPNARIVGFEPWETAFECAVRNVERNGWKNVSIHHAAVGKKEDVMQLTVVEENSLAGSLTGRLDTLIERKHWSKSVQNVKVVRLSDYIDCPVDFIKMDIEGLENDVVKEIGDKLENVSRMFVEYHYGPNLEGNSLTEILDILTNAGFAFEISKSRSYAELTKRRPFLHVGEIVSELIWAVKKV